MSSCLFDAVAIATGYVRDDPFRTGLIQRIQAGALFRSWRQFEAVKRVHHSQTSTYSKWIPPTITCFYSDRRQRDNLANRIVMVDGLYTLGELSNYFYNMIVTSQN
ncbi:hypothetical protein AVEN_129235-1 [Araneus ventricosus]|uniref:Uncharacterized protein n=1 Tax=Araneus ventricosus TaxID=182803 RepID=A0A4Y2CVV3_ARAVE|nr:hypothetical protein AVEN_190100-1 [Araneus ventricosus]GBM08612.1 hypothetical protein AVEN_195044-1 [Araneus ventricosus]GBM08687.1 hypothetical protein AVEN_46527-1 [Araneus ventricosus]GBM08788.1 hypothetical protein AVEN_129235-1 [Araneus ventricosus]